MLAGLAGIALPVIAHLLSRKKYDLVEWGAMQFLELDPSAKRKIRLEELLLLLVRIGLVAMIAIALARPWIGSQWLGGFVSTQPRDVVLIVDGSYSMGWDLLGNGKTPHSRSMQLAREFLGDLLPGDAIQIIDAREQPQVVLPDATRDAYRAKETLNDLAAPSGAADLAAAVQKGVQLLASGTNLQREVVVFTDLQALSWKSGDETLWARFDDVRSQSPIAPRVWVIDASGGELGEAANFTIDRLQLSRELAIVGVPVKISSKVKFSGGDSPIARKVHLEIDQLRLPDQSVQIKLQPQGETTVDFEYRFESAGSHLISLVLDDDALPGDNRADAVVTVTESLPALLIDGDHKLDATKCETFFANAALLSAGDEQPWIKPTVITPDQLTIDRLKPMSIAVIANVATLSDAAIDGLRQFVASGHGVLFTLGDKVDKDHYRSKLFADGKGVLPGRLDQPGTEDGKEKRGVRVLGSSLEQNWLQPFRADRGGTLSDARWSRWWKVVLPKEAAGKAGSLPPNEDRDELFVDKLDPESSLKIGTSIVEARLTTGDPLLVTRRYGRGVTALLTSSLDADWNTLPAKQDYVPFLHELLFSLATPTASRNLDVGSPLILIVSPDLKIDDYQFLNPANKPLTGEKIDGSFEPAVRLRTTTLPGVYRFTRKILKPNEPNRPEYFVANFDRSESVLTPLTEAEREVLAKDDRMKFVTDLPDLRKSMFADSSRTEIWWMILYVFLASLAVEAWMTRRMVHGGYSVMP
jgi:von Willebrand factor type A domain/Aerotolerance regulator N-terminal